jgi:hypothetical protein
VIPRNIGSYSAMSITPITVLTPDIDAAEMHVDLSSLPVTSPCQV